MPQIMAPLAMAVGISVSLIVIAVIVRRTMQEAELESTIENEERCKTCKDKYPVHDLCSTIPHICDTKDKAIYAAELYFEEATGGLPPVQAVLEEPGRSNDSCKQPGMHVELEIQLPKGIVEVVGENINHPGSLVSCNCCRETSKGPQIDEQWGVTAKLVTFEAKDNITGKTYILFDKHSGSRLLINAELPGCGW